MNNGWIKLHRKFLNWEWYGCPKVTSLFIHCLLKANHKKKKWRGNTIPRGTFITSYSSLSNETGLSTREIRTAFEKLESTGEIDKRSTSANSWVTVVNYDDYQKCDKQATSKRQASDKGATTTKNEKNEKNEKKSTNGRASEDSNIPTKEECISYFTDNGYSEVSAIKFYEYYQESVEGTQKQFWRDSKGNKVRNWKMKARAVWFKDENKISEQEQTMSYHNRL